jgi:hypothetical protein
MVPALREGVSTPHPRERGRPHRHPTAARTVRGLGSLPSRSPLHGVFAPSTMATVNELQTGTRRPLCSVIDPRTRTWKIGNDAPGGME